MPYFLQPSNEQFEIISCLTEREKGEQRKTTWFSVMEKLWMRQWRSGTKVATTSGSSYPVPGRQRTTLYTQQTEVVF